MIRFSSIATVVAFFSIAGYAAKFGVQVNDGGEEGLVRIVKDYGGCTKTIAAAVDVLTKHGLALGQDLHGSRSGIAAEIVATESKPFTMERISTVSIAGNPLVFIPSDTFLMHTSDSNHKSMNSSITLEGVYLTVPRAKNEMEKFFSEHFLTIKIVQEGQAIAAGSYFLIPVEQFLDMDAIHKTGADVVLAYDSAGSMVRRNITRPIQPGIEKTGSGKTWYHFDENGTVTIYGERGTKVFSPPQKESFSSHRAILARQGIFIDSDDPVEAIQVGIRHNLGAIENHAKSIDALARIRVHFSDVGERLRQYLEVNTRWPEFDKATHFFSVMVMADTIDSLLPSHLRWSSPSKLASRTARISEGTPIRGEVVPFLLFKGHTGPDGHPGDMLRALEQNAIHLQGAHAHLGSFALKLEEENRIRGGHLKFTYDPNTGKLVKIGLENDRMFSLSRPGETIILTNEERAWLQKHLSANRELAGCSIEIDKH